MVAVMPEAQRSLAWRQSALALEARLREMTGQAPVRLAPTEVASCYSTRPYVAAWRLGISFSDGKVRRIDVVASSGFPVTPVRTALVDRPPDMTWPHVEHDGILCLLPNMSEVDPDNPVEVGVDLLRRSVTLVEELLEGVIIERDFREEFLTYWAYQTHKVGAPLFSLVDPGPQSRSIRFWKGKEFDIVGEDAASIATWVRRRFGKIKEPKCEAGAYIWLNKPLLPSEYPQTAADLRALAVAAGEDAVAVLDAAAVEEPDHLVVILGATGRGGPGLIAVRVPNPKLIKSHPRPPSDPLSKGFRSRHTPSATLLDRYFGSGPVMRHSVQRADASWIHGRGRDPRTGRLLGSTVVLIGCGSIGAPVACALAQAGVGKLILIDPDTLAWPNVGRHPMGATAVGLNKAVALAERLQADYPHLEIEGKPHSIQGTIIGDSEPLASADLIIAATGSWAAENALNRWHVEQGRTKPVIYGWTEAHACAGHAVAIAAEAGCFQCNIDRTGHPSFRVVEWPNGGDANEEEPACGAHYQPYGPIEIGFVTSMIGELALDCIMSPPRSSFSRVYAADQARIEKLGARWSSDWLALRAGLGSNIRIAERSWLSSSCKCCGESSLPEISPKIAQR